MLEVWELMGRFLGLLAGRVMRRDRGHSVRSWRVARQRAGVVFFLVLLFMLVYQFQHLFQPDPVSLRRDLYPLDVTLEVLEPLRLDDDEALVRGRGSGEVSPGGATMTVNKLENGYAVHPVKHPRTRRRSKVDVGMPQSVSLAKDNRDSYRGLEEQAKAAFAAGAKKWEELQQLLANNSGFGEAREPLPSEKEVCLPSRKMSGWEFGQAGNTMLLPCGLVFGSAITIQGRPREAHFEHSSTIGRKDEKSVPISQFFVDLLGLGLAHNDEEVPRILHLNPRVRGDWSQKPVIEHNSCYRGQWGNAQRCDGTASSEDSEPRVEGYLTCEPWADDQVSLSEEKISSWPDWIRGTKTPAEWKFPFVENRDFSLTLRAGYQGYHVMVNGRHISSVPYRPSFVVEEATGLSVGGDIDIDSVSVVDLPTSYPTFSSLQLLEEWSSKYKAPQISEGPTELFIGIMSRSDHFIERMAVRKTWMQSKSVQDSTVVARFFVSLDADQVTNAQLVKEANFYNDIVIVPFMDSYPLVVLKTYAICEHAVGTFMAQYIMKCDDDTFIRVEAILSLVRNVPPGKSVYIGSMNYYHEVLRGGKWAVTYEEWSGDVYPPYANGPGYIISSDIAHYTVKQQSEGNLTLFKMEDVAMGMWVAEFHQQKKVEIRDEKRFCQAGCVPDYYSAHYQTPRLMMCLWRNLIRGSGRCCD